MSRELPEGLEKYKWKKGQSGNPAGRKKKFITIAKEEGYALTEINDAIQQILGMQIHELREIGENPKATILEKTVAKALYTSYSKGKLDNLETLLSRVFGKPKQQIDGNIEGEITVKFQDGFDIAETS